jgi:uncharacterized protein
VIAELALLAALTAPPAPTQRVTDTVNALRPATRDALEGELRGFETQTGHQVIVWIGDTTNGVPLEDWTSQTAERWKIGRKGKDDGAILFVFMRDHKVRIEVGYGLESKLTDAKSAQIVDDTIVPAMRRGDVDGAVQTGVDRMLAVINPAAASVMTTATPPPASDDDDNGVGEVVTGLVVLLLVFGVLFAIVITIVRRGKPHGDWLDAFLMSRAMGPAAGWGGFIGGGGGGGGGGFSGGGGGFGGGGASGGW